MNQGIGRNRRRRKSVFENILFLSFTFLSESFHDFKLEIEPSLKPRRKKVAGNFKLQRLIRAREPLLVLRCRVLGGVGSLEQDMNRVQQRAIEQETHNCCLLDMDKTTSSQSKRGKRSIVDDRNVSRERKEMKKKNIFHATIVFSEQLRQL